MGLNNNLEESFVMNIKGFVREKIISERSQTAAAIYSMRKYSIKVIKHINYML